MWTAATIVSALAGAYLFDLLRVPAGALIGAMVGVGTLNLIFNQAVPPSRAINFLAFAALGWGLGASINRQTAQQLLDAKWAVLAVVLGLLLFGLILAVTLVWTGLLDAATALLAASPGGISQMSALAISVGADSATVVIVHLARVIAVVLVIPVALQVLAD